MTAKIIFQFLVGLFLSFLLMLFDGRGRLLWVRAGIEAAARPELFLFRSVVSRVESWVAVAAYISSGPERIADLERRLLAAEHELRNAQGDASGIEESAALTANVLSAGQELVIARVPGLAVGQVVVGPSAVFLGTVDRIGRWSARVRQPSDSGSELRVAIVGEDGGQRAQGVIVGEFGGRMVLTKVLTEIELRPSQVIVTEGADDVAPPGLTVGWVGQEIRRVESSVYQEAVVESPVNFSDLRTVSILVP